MKVLLFNGSSRPTGCTFTALSEVAKILNSEGIETEILQSGNGAFRDCIACGFCAQNSRCVFNDDVVNEWTQKAEKADGFVFGSPVYYAHPSGRILSLMDRMLAQKNIKRYENNPATRSDRKKPEPRPKGRTLSRIRGLSLL